MGPAIVEKTIWDELPESKIDTTRLEYLFESKAKDLLSKVIFFVNFFLSFFL